MIRRSLLLLVALCLGALVVLPTAHAAARQRCFDVNGLCVSDPLLGYWERNGGLSVFGYPLADAHMETAEGRTLRVQWFERDRLEIQNDGSVTAGRLGARALELQGRPWETFPTVAAATPGCIYFTLTKHQLCAPFLRYWMTHGGLERFGYAITEPISEEIEGHSYTVQYFERRRMEYHPELAGTSYEILLGLLGKDLVETDSCIALEQRFEPTAYAYRAILGCPLAPAREMVGTDRVALRNVPLAIEHFERGTLLWVREFDGDTLSPGTIFVITPDPSTQALIWQQFPDLWVEGQPTGVVDSPPAGRFAPVRGFGYLWAHNPDVRARVGWAIEPESGDTGGYRRFQKGFMLYRPLTDRFFLITDDRLARDIPRS
jgi:hypothetical protein